MIKAAKKGYIAILNKYNKARLKDLEEKWGLWLKKNNLESSDSTIGRENEIKKLYYDFEKTIEKEISDEIILNPFTFLEGMKYSKAVERDENCCFYGHYLNSLQSINNTKYDSDKNAGMDGIKKTMDIIQQKIIPQIQGIECVSSLAKKNNHMLSSQYKYLSEDINLRLNSLQNLMQKLNENYEQISGTVGNEKKVLHLKPQNTKELANKEYSNIIFLSDLGIDFYYEITVEVKKDYFGIFCIIFIGICEFVGGCLLKATIGNDFGLMKEGLEDIKYGIECLFGDKDFSWEDVGRRKLAFLINLAVSFAVGFITGQSKLQITQNKGKENFKDLIKQGAKELGKYTVKKGVQYVCKNIFGEKLIKEVIKKVKDFIDEKCINFFDKNIRKFLEQSKEFQQMLAIDNIIGDNSWQNHLNTQMNLYCKAFTSLINPIINIVIDIIKNILNNEEWEKALINIMSSFKNNLLEILNQGIDDFLNNLKVNFFSIFNQFADIENKVNKGIRTINDILIKQCNLAENEIDDVIYIIKQNKIISINGIINGKMLFGNNYREVSNNISLKLTSKFEICNNYIKTAKGEINNITSNIEQKIEDSNNLFNVGSFSNIDQNNSHINEGIVPVKNINFGKYEAKKEQIIESLKNIKNKLDKFNPSQKCEEIIKLLRNHFINEIINIVLEALHSSNFKDYLVNIQNEFNETLRTVSNSLDNVDSFMTKNDN